MNKMNTSKTRRHKIFYRSSLHKGATSPLRRPQRAGSLSTLFLPQSTTKIKIESLTQILPQEKGNTNFQGTHNQGAALGDAYPSRSQAPRVTNAIYQPNDEQMLERWKFQLTMSMSRLSTQILLLTQGLDDSFQRLAQEWCREVNLSSRSVLACVESADK